MKLYRPPPQSGPMSKKWCGKTFTLSCGTLEVKNLSEQLGTRTIQTLRWFLQAATGTPFAKFGPNRSSFILFNLLQNIQFYINSCLLRDLILSPLAPLWSYWRITPKYHGTPQHVSVCIVVTWDSNGFSAQRTNIDNRRVDRSIVAQMAERVPTALRPRVWVPALDPMR